MTLGWAFLGELTLTNLEADPDQTWISQAEQIFANASDGILTILWPKEPSKVAGNQ